MKFLKQALAVALMTASSVEGRKFNQAEFDKKVAAGQYDKQKLLRNAVPYKGGETKARRRAQDGQDQAEADGYGYGNYDNYQRVEVTSKFKLQFNSCLTLETENYNMLLDNLVDYAAAGDIVSVRNYVLFDVCAGDDCEQQTWMVDLLTFIEAVMDYGPTRQSIVCDACQTYGEDVCGETYYYYGGAQYNNGGRSLANNNGYSVQYELFDEQMCSYCKDYQCWYDGEGDQQEDFASIEEWIATIAECKMNDATWNDLNTYSGFMCNSDGSGIEIGVFLDESCRMYNRNLHYSSIMANEDYQYYFQSQDVIPYMFTDVIECRDLSYVQYVDEDTYSTLQSQGNYYYNQGYGAVSEACQALFYGDFIPRSMSYCGQVKNWTDAELAQYTANGYNNQNQNNGNNNNNGYNMYQYIQAQTMMYNNYGHDTSWYTYDLGAFEVMDSAAVCEKVLQKWSNAGYSTGKSAAQIASSQSSSSSSSSSESSEYYGGTGISNVFVEEDNSNNFWKWSNGNTASGSSASSNSTAYSGQSQPQWLFPTRNNNSALQTAGTRLSPLEIAWIVIASVSVTALFMHLTRKQVLKRRMKKELEKEVYVKTDENGSPLIIS